MIKKNNSTYQRVNQMNTLFLFILFSAALNVASAVAGEKKPLTPKAFVIRYWDKHIRNNLPKPSFLISKASPLSAIDTAKFTNLAATNALPTRLPEFCYAAHLLCLAKHTKDVKYINGEKFIIYTDGSVSATQAFANYSDQSNVGDDTFHSYAKKSGGSAQEDFSVSGNKGCSVTFAGDYKITRSTSTNSLGASTINTNVSNVSSNLVKRWVEPGKFFRERMLRQGTVMPMPDIRDKLPKRSFLPRSISSKIPFTSSKISELKRMFNISDNSFMENVMMDSLRECERAPGVGETKRCVGSLEDMIDFATSVLDWNVAVRTTENVNGSGKNVMLDKVKGINGGKVTKSVSCHQSLFSYLLYYCHSFSKVRLYEADLLNTNSKAKINHGVAICHLDTTSWSPTHDAFLSLGMGPGRIEVCHWFFEKDMTWTIAD